MNTIASIMRQNMHLCFSLDIICSSKFTIFLEFRSRKTVHPRTNIRAYFCTEQRLLFLQRKQRYFPKYPISNWLYIWERRIVETFLVRPYLPRIGVRSILLKVEYRVCHAVSIFLGLILFSFCLKSQESYSRALKI